MGSLGNIEYSFPFAITRLRIDFKSESNHCFYFLKKVKGRGGDKLCVLSRDSFVDRILVFGQNFN